MGTEAITRVLKKQGVNETRIADSIQLLSEQFDVEEIEDFYAMEKGMTNRMFHFRYGGGEYLIRVPGEGTSQMIDRHQEAWVYRTLKGQGITDNYICIDPDKGIKITQYISNAHTCNPKDKEEVKKCIRHLYHFHQQKLTGKVEFDVFERMERYEEICRHDMRDYFPDYDETRRQMLELKELIQQTSGEKQLCHVDPVQDNFLIRDGKIYLIDWEYAAMGDPHMDIAMFCIYAGYHKCEIDEVIDFYFKEGCKEEIRRKIYAYVAVCGFLWTIWCEIKRDSGVLFEEYEALQYRYAKEYYGYATAPFDGEEGA